MKAIWLGSLIRPWLIMFVAQCAVVVVVAVLRRRGKLQPQPTLRERFASLPLILVAGMVGGLLAGGDPPWLVSFAVLFTVGLAVAWVLGWAVERWGRPSTGAQATR